MAAAKSTSAKTGAKNPSAKKKTTEKGVLTKAKDAIVDAYHTVVDGAAHGAVDGVAAAINKKIGGGKENGSASKPVPRSGGGKSAKGTLAKSKPAASGGSVKDKPAAAAKSTGAKSKSTSAGSKAKSPAAKKSAASAK